MGMRSPQDMQVIKTRPQSSSRFSGAAAPKIDTSFVGNLQQTLTSQEKARIQKDEDDTKWWAAEYENAGDELVIKAKAAVGNTEGLAVIDEDERQKKFIQKGLEQKLKTIPERFRPLVEQKSGAILNKYDTFATPHTYSQIKKTQDNAFKTRVVNTANDVIEQSADLDKLGTEGMARLATVIAERAERKYGKDPERHVSPGVKVKDLVANEIMMGKSETFRKAIEMQANVGRVDIAEQIIARYEHELIPADRVKAAKILEAARETVGTKEALNLSSVALRMGGGDKALTEAYVRENAKDDKEYFRTMQAIRIDWDIDDKQTKKSIEDAKAKIITGVAAGKGMRDPDIQANLLKIPADERNTFLDQVNRYGRGNVITDQASYDRVEDILQNGSDDQIRALNLDAFATSIGRAEMEMLRDWQNRRINEKNKEFAAVQRNGDKEVGVLAVEVARINKIKRPEEINKLKLLARQSANMHLQGNARITSPELRKKVLADLMSRGVVDVPKKPSGFLERIGWRDPGTRKAPADSMEGDVDVHPSWRDAVKATDPSLSESQINQALEVLKRSGKDLSRPR